MPRNATHCRKVINSALLPLAAFCLLDAGIAAAKSGGGKDETRESTSRYVEKGGRGHGSGSETSKDSFPALVTEGSRNDRNAAESSKLSPAKGKSSNDFWIYYADVELFNDDDRDGYFHGIDVLFDADTVYEVADVYAVLYLSYEGGPWNEYAVTKTFSLFGATSDDEYVVVTELESGYPTGNYDLLLELYDVFDGSLVAEMAPEHNSAFSLLPLEDFNRDDPHRRPRHRHGGGAFDWLLVIFAASIAGLRGRRY